MTKNVTIIRDVFDRDAFDRFENVESVGQTLSDNFTHWPASARIYDGVVAKERDVTPRCEEDIAALERLGSREVIVVNYPGDPITIIVAVIAVAAVAASLLLIPTIPSLGNQQTTSPNNQLADRQNRARPLGRIPDIYGQVRSTLDLIASPYSIYASNQEIEVALMCVGRGEFLIEDVRDDTTLLSSIDGASAEFYAPDTELDGGTPFLTIGAPINRNIVTSKRITSVNGQVLEGVSGGSGSWVGPFEVSLRRMTRVSVNAVALQGMFKDDGDQTSTNVTVQVEVQPLDDAGVASGPATTVNGTIFGSASNRDLKAITITVNLAGEINRAEVRMRRTTPLNTSFEGTVVDEVKWRDLYGQAAVENTNFGDVTTVLTETLGTAGALSLKARKLNCLVTRRLPSRVGEYDFTTALTPTRSAAAALCHIALDDRIGRMSGGLTIDQGGLGEVDVPLIFSEVAAVVDYFGIEDAGEFNYTFDREDLTFQEMAQIIATTAFCEAYRRGSLLKVLFERPQEDSALLFNHANKLPGSETRTYSFGSLDSNDGVDLKYVDPSDDAIVSLYVPQGDESASNPLKVEGLGIRGFEHAYLHAWRRWNRIRYRYLSESFEAMQEADLLVRRERFLSVDTTRAEVMDGEVLSQSGLTLTLSQIAILDPLESWTCFLQLSSGTVEPIEVTQGLKENEVVLAAPPAEPLVLDGDAAYRTGYVIVQDGSDAQIATPMLLSAKDPGEGFTVKVEGVNYDDRYYDNDRDFVAEEDENSVDPSAPDNPGGGTPDPNVIVSISPPASSTNSNAPSHQRGFFATGVGGATGPTDFVWGVDSGPGWVQSQNGLGAATLGCFDDDTVGTSTAQFFCDMLIDGVVYRAYCTMTHSYNGDVDWNYEWDRGSHPP